MLNVPDALPMLVRRHRAHDRVLDARGSPSRCRRRRSSAAGSAASRRMPGRRSARSSRCRRPGAAGRRPTNGRSPIRSDQRPGDRRDDEQRRGPRQQPQPGVERAVVPARSAGTGHEEHGAEQRRDRKKIAALPAENGRERNSRIGSIGSGARRSQSTNATASSTPDGQRRDHLGAAPAGRVAAHQPPHDPERGAGDQRQAGDVEARSAAVALLDRASARAGSPTARSGR